MNHDALRDLVASLIRVTEEESRCLADTPRRRELPQLAAAKARVQQQLDAHVADLGRARPDWVRTMPHEERRDLGALMAELGEVAQHNGAMLQRQIAAAEELIHAIGKELRHLSGHKSATYGKSGRMHASGGASPMSINKTL